METTDRIESRIIDEAKRQFIEKGFEQTAMSDIAAALAINRPTLHYYFRTKEKLFQAVFSSIVAEVLPRIEAIFSTEIPMRRRIERVVDTYFALFTANPSIPRFIVGEIQRDVDMLLDTFRSLGCEQYVRNIETALLAAMEAGELRRMPIPVLFMSFYSQAAFPFLARKLLERLFLADGESFDPLLRQWKENLLRQLEALLLPGETPAAEEK